MSGSRIKGITIDIGGDTTRLNKALEQSEKKLYGTQAALKDVNKLLKLDPANTELLAQKQKLLQQAIQETEGKLKTLKTASEQAAGTAKKYDAWKAAYTPVQEEVVKTNEKIDKLKKSMKSLEESGNIDTEEYRSLQSEVDESTEKLKTLKTQKKQIDVEFGKPISPEAFDSLQREIIETEQDLKNLQSTAGSSSATLEKISAKTGKFGESATAAGKKMLPLTAALGGVGTASVVMANNFDDAMSQAAGALKKPMSDMEELRKLAIKTGQDTIFSATDAGNAITELAKGGLSEADIKAGALQTTMDLAASSGLDLGNAANVVVQSMGAFGLTADQSAEAANALAGAAAASSTDVGPLTEALAQCSAGAKNAGWDIQETTAVLGRFADAGIVGSDAGTSLKTMLRKLSAPTSEAAKLMQGLGINTRDSSGNLLGASSMAEELQNKLGGLDSASRDAALSTIFGSDAMRAATVMMDSGSEGLKKYITAANDQDAAQRLANAQMGEGSRSIEELKGSLETAAIQIGDSLAPVIQKLADFLTNLANKFSALPSGVQQAIVIIGAVVAAIGPLLMIIGQLSLGISAVTKVFSKIKIIDTFKNVILGVGNAFKVLWGIISLNPFTIILTIIAAVIAIFVVLYNKCAWFRDGVNAIWENIKAAFHAAWDGIVTFFTETLPGAWDSVVAFFQGIPEWWAGVWDGTKAKFEEVWNAILANPVVNAIVTTIASLIDNLKNTLSGIWDGIKSIAGGAWELIKNVILGPVLLLIDLVTGNFGKLKSDAENIWNNIKDAALTIWNGIKQVVSSVVEGIVGFVKTIMEGMKNIVSSIWNGIKNVASSIWGGIKDTISNLVNGAKDLAVNGFKALKDGIKNAITSLPKIVKGIFDSIKNIIKSLISGAGKWGSDFINGLKEGIMSGINSIIDKVKGLADKIRSFLHFSRPDEGPLRDYETWMPDFMNGLAKGIDQSAHKVMSSVNRVAGAMSNGMSGGLQFAAETGSQTVNVNNDLLVQIGNEQFDAHIVKVSKTGIGNEQRTRMRAKGGRSVRNY